MVMPWKENSTMDLRAHLIRDFETGYSATELAGIYQVSRRTVYKWIDRHAAEGVAGLADRSRAPRHRPQQLDPEMVARLIEARQRWKWGPRKLLAKLTAEEPHTGWPAASTIADVLKRAGLTQRRRPRRHTPPGARPFGDVAAVNQTWCADFKGWFRTRDGTRCDPLTITDAHSRYLLCCQIVPKTDTLHVRALFEAAFRNYGLPEAIRTDNGPPFASTAPGGLSRLSLTWIRLGIRVERTKPASPQENGRHERMHLTLKQDTLNPPEANPRRQQEAFDRFQLVYNEERPHEALANQTPASVYTCSPRPMPRRLPELEYPEGYFVRQVMQGGEISWEGRCAFISEVLRHEPVGLKPHTDRYYEVFYGPVALGWLDSWKCRFQRQLNKRQREELEKETA